MKYILCGLVLLATLGVAQQPRPVPPPESTPPTFPQEHTPGQQMPPDTAAPPAMSSIQVQRQIEQHMNTAPALAGSNVDVKTDEQTVVLTGIVDTQEQHDVALRIANSFAGDRQIVDRIKIRQQA